MCVIRTLQSKTFVLIPRAKVTDNLKNNVPTSSFTALQVDYSIITRILYLGLLVLTIKHTAVLGTKIHATKMADGQLMQNAVLKMK